MQTALRPAGVGVLFSSLVLIASVGCGRTHTGDLGSPDWSPWVAVGRRAQVDSYVKFDLVKGRHYFIEFSDGHRRMADRDVLLETEAYMDVTGWFEHRRGEPRRPLHVVTLWPTVCIWDAGYTEPGHSRTWAAPWAMTDELYVVRLDSEMPPERLQLEDLGEGGRAVVDLPWGRLLIFPGEDRLEMIELPASASPVVERRARRFP